MAALSFEAPVWESQTLEYRLQLKEAFANELYVRIQSQPSTGFHDEDEVLNITDDIIATLIENGEKQKWFAKMPTQEQLMKKVRHTFSALATADNNVAKPVLLRMNPKTVTIVWRPETKENQPVPLMFEDSEAEESEDDAEQKSDGEDELEIPESNLPPVSLRDEEAASREQYLLSRLRAAKARMEAEQIRMQYFEATGNMPPDSDSEDESDEEV